MKLTKEECLKAVNILDSFSKNNANSLRELVDLIGALSVIDILINEHFELVTTCDKLEKALDRACGDLENLEQWCWESEDFRQHGVTLEPMTKEQWKEYLMNEK